MALTAATAEGESWEGSSAIIVAFQARKTWYRTQAAYMSKLASRLRASGREQGLSGKGGA